MRLTRRGEREGWRRILDAGTGLVVVLALGLLVHDRLLPELRRAREVEIGEEMPRELSYRLLSTGDTVSAAPGPALHLVFQSRCPACGRNLPRWREILSARPGLRAYGVGMEPAGPALAYVRRHLATALAAAPGDRARYLRLLRIDAVPATLVVDARGRLAWRRVGVLGAADVEEILARLPSPSLTRSPSTGEIEP